MGQTRDGRPIYSHWDEKTNALRYYTVLPDGRTVYSNENGEPVSAHENAAFPLAIIGGSIGGVAFGPVGVLVGALLGAFLGEQAGKGNK